VIRAAWHPLARRELFESSDFYDQQAPGLGEVFLTRVEKSIEQIQRFPESGSRTAGEIRQSLVRGFPYSVIYRLDQESIFLLAIAHHKRQPRYWAGRA